MQKEAKRATKQNPRHRSRQHCLFFALSCAPNLLQVTFVYSKKFQVHDFVPIYVQNFVVQFFPIIPRLQVPVMTRLALIEVVCFSKILIQRVQKFCATRYRYWPIRSCKMSTHIILHFLSLSLATKVMKKPLNTGKFILRSNFDLLMPVNFGYLFEEIYTCHL